MVFAFFFNVSTFLQMEGSICFFFWEKILYKIKFCVFLGDFLFH
ncbi:hypothetical protein UNSWCS_932 [Campylobacter concisus UNSWCS]|uniref:Uncharacterized protein n=1 Tax=Campylobacter concisus UNSWCS TaxID=1242968 RepID=U2GRQ2_9BACT|nr:hypothetical protein UNSWCS_932 [Campylobacter concisus UNSWCS]